jgi:hypothetical protein
MLKVGASTTAWMQELGRKPLLLFLYSPHPCGLAMQGAMFSNLSYKSFSVN